MGRKIEREVIGLGFGGKRSEEYESVNEIFREGLVNTYLILNDKISPCDEKALANIMASLKICEDMKPTETVALIKADLEKAANKMRDECHIPKNK